MEEIKDTVYLAYDGTKHLTKDACLNHEKYQRQRDICDKYNIDAYELSKCDFFGEYIAEECEDIVAVALYRRVLDLVEGIVDSTIDAEAEASKALRLLIKYAREGISENI